MIYKLIITKQTMLIQILFCILLFSAVFALLPPSPHIYGMPIRFKKPIHVYQYGYDIKDEHGNKQWKEEKSDGKGTVIGNYGFLDTKGVERSVKYIADKKGFRVKIVTNEPGTANLNPAHVRIVSRPIPFRLFKHLRKHRHY